MEERRSVIWRMVKCKHGQVSQAVPLIPSQKSAQDANSHTPLAAQAEAGRVYSPLLTVSLHLFYDKSLEGEEEEGGRKPVCDLNVQVHVPALPICPPPSSLQVTIVVSTFYVPVKAYYVSAIHHNRNTYYYYARV